MNDSNFDALAFLGATVDEAMTERSKVPEGDYIATILPFTEQSFKDGQYNQGERAGKPWKGINFRLEIDLQPYPDALQRVGVPKVTIYHLVFLDLGEDGKSLDMGPDKNRGLASYRKALGQNNKGESWSLLMMNHRQVRVTVKHGVDKRDGSVREEISGVAAI